MKCKSAPIAECACALTNQARAVLRTHWKIGNERPHKVGVLARLFKAVTTQISWIAEQVAGVVSDEQSPMRSG